MAQRAVAKPIFSVLRRILRSRRSLFLLFASLPIFCAQAEYRAYQLEITSPSGISQQVVSTLDAHQYTAYYHVPIENSVVLKNHWMCYGRTSDFIPICPPPKSTSTSNEKASLKSK